MNPERQEKLKNSVRFFYDLQKLRMQTSNRSKSDTADLEDGDQDFLGNTSDVLKGLERGALRETARWLKGVDIYEGWLKEQKGCGPTMSGVIVSEIEMCRKVNPDFLEDATFSDEFKIEGFTYFRVKFIEKRKMRDEGKVQEIPRDLLCYQRKVDGKYEVWEDCCPTVSSLWAYCGLAVDTKTGKAVRRAKGVKSNWNPFVKTKMVGVLADCLLRANSPWREHYDNYKHRWQTAGKGTSDGHRHNAAKRYMMKMFLAGLHTAWREVEGLPVRPTYSEEFAGKTHHGPQALSIN